MRKIILPAFLLFACSFTQAENYYQAAEIIQGIHATARNWETLRHRTAAPSPWLSPRWVPQQMPTRTLEMERIHKEIFPLLNSELQEHRTPHTGIPMASKIEIVDMESLQKIRSYTAGMFSENPSDYREEIIASEKKVKVSFHQCRDQFGIKLLETILEGKELASSLEWNNHSLTGRFKQTLGWMQVSQEPNIGEKSILTWIPPAGRTNYFGIFKYAIKHPSKDTLFGIRFYLSPASSTPLYPAGQMNRIARLTCALLRI